MLKFVRIFVVFAGCFLAVQGINAATFVVTKTADTNDGTCDADCSLREAVAAANTSVEADTITFSSLFNSSQTITLGGTDIIINSSGGLQINGPGANLLTVSGNNASRVFTNNTGAVTTIAGIRVTGGTGTSTVQTGRGGGIYNNGGTLTLSTLIVTGNASTNGGGANNAGTATLNIVNCVFSNNTATGAGGALQNFLGNTTNIRDSSFNNNTANSTGTGGGAMQANGTVNITNSTFASNTATGGSGGAIYYNGSGLVMTNVTMSANTSTQNGGGIHKATSTLNAFVRNNIFALNNGTAGSPDMTGDYNSNGNNIIGNVGTSTGWVAADLQNINPGLGAFGSNGGFGNTFLPNPGSPAIDAGNNCVRDLSCAANNPPFAVIEDQRGVSRTANGNVDIGAVEVATAVPVSVGGRVLTENGNPLANVRVFITTPGGTRYTKTNSFGNYVFSNVFTGTSATVGVAAKGYSYNDQVVNISGQITNLDFTPAN